MHGFGAIMFSMDGGRTIDKNGAINVNKIQRKPWSFTIVFDEAKAARHGYSLDALYDHVGKIAESFGNVRIGRGSWQAKEILFSLDGSLPNDVTNTKKQSPPEMRAATAQTV